MKPSQVYKIEEPLVKKTRFQFGDKVRITKWKNIFEKAFTPNWSCEVFTIRAVIHSNPETYPLKDSFNNPIKGGFYKYELLKAKHPDIFQFEKVLKTKAQDVLVKWLGHDDTHNSWINKNSML